MGFQASLKQAVRRACIRATSGDRAQAALGRAVVYAQWLRGVGSGGGVGSSGEEAVVAELCRDGRADYVVFDVGANRGDYARMLCESVGRERPDARLQLHCFEPSSSAFALLEDNTRGLPHVTLNHLALGASAGTARLYSNAPASGLASLTRRDLRHAGIDFSSSETVSVSTVTDYCRDQEIDAIDLLKMDVEGHELDVLRGAMPLLEAGRIRLLTFEFGGCNIDSRTFFRDYYYLLADLGMRLSRITPAGNLQPVAAYSEYLEQYTTTNYLAYRPL